MITVKVQFIHESAKMPKQGSEQAAGWDVFATKDGFVDAGRRARVALGFCVELPEGWCAKLKQRSSMFERGILVNDSPIDSDYRGEVCALVTNLSDWAWYYKKGERIGQLIYEPVPVVRHVKVDELSATARGVGGFGSTGK